MPTDEERINMSPGDKKKSAFISGVPYLAALVNLHVDLYLAGLFLPYAYWVVVS